MPIRSFLLLHSLALSVLVPAIGSCTRPRATFPRLDIEMDAQTLVEPNRIDPDRGQLRGSNWIRISSPGLESLTLRPRGETDHDLLPIAIEVRPCGPRRAVLSGFVGFGGGMTTHVAYLVGLQDGRLALLDELRSDGSPFLVPWRFETTQSGAEMWIHPCQGDSCAHVSPRDLRTSRWSLTPEEFLARHHDGPAARLIDVSDGRFELAPLY